MNFSLSKGLGFGILLWGIMFLLGWLLVTIGVTLSIWWIVALAIVAGVLSYGFALSANPHSSGTALAYGLTWAVIGVVLDALVTNQFTQTPALFGMWSYWLGYVLVLLAPWAQMSVRQSPVLTTR